MNPKTNRIGFVICIIVLMFTFSPGCTTKSNSPEGSTAKTDVYPSDAEQTQAVPKIVLKDGKIVLLSADRSVVLCSENEMVNKFGSKRLQGTYSRDKTYIYFLNAYDSKTGTGTLMGVGTDAKTAPVTISDGVYSAKNLFGGILFIKNVKDGAGDLYICMKNGSPELKAQNVIPTLYGSSPDGKSFYYVKKEGGDYILFEDFKGSTQKILDTTAENFRYPYIYPENDGQMLYGASDNIDTLKIYLYSDGKSSEIITGAQSILLSSITGGFLYTNSDTSTGVSTLYYKEIGKDAVCISRNLCSYQFPDYVKGRPYGKSFLLSEEDADNPKPSETTIVINDSDFSSSSDEPETSIGDTSEKDNIDLYEYTLGGDKTFISKANFDNRQVYGTPEPNKKFTAVSYELNGALYISLKKDGVWVPRQISKDVIQSQFDDSGDNFYWVDKEYKLYKMSLSDEKTELIKEGIMSFTIIGDEVFATDNMNMFRISNGAKLCDYADKVIEAQGGVYIRKSNGDILYFADGCDKGETVIKGAEDTSLSGTIRFSYLSAKDADAFNNLCEDARYYLNKYGIMTDETTIASPHSTLQEDMAIADSFLPGTVPDDDLAAAEFFSDGFKNLENNEQNGNDITNPAGDKLLSAVSIYEEQNNIEPVKVSQ